MAQSQVGITQLLNAEAEAQKIINNARKEKAERLKEARKEAESEIRSFRAEKEGEYQKHSQQFMSGRDAVVTSLETTTSSQIQEVQKSTEQNIDKVADMLLSFVFDVYTKVEEKNY
eukprot:TRINITY_DN812_c0_g1_i2.p1 TRINITY_DN812_c0_g1~~TRINITY_DN812_c0_g1_i2.p1  ORF type:complete len:116 (-),score=40.71 TRINITY_DN812_c0_g1_i2:134-481(-)